MWCAGWLDAFNVRNTQELIQNLKDTPLLPCHSLTSLDITNMYSNIPIVETKSVMTDILKLELVNPQALQEITKLYDIITGQNYFTHNNDIITQYGGLTMGAPSSGLIAEIFLQHTEHKYLPHITRKHKIINNCRYVDDILIIFYSSHTIIQQIVNDFNALHPNLHFTAEMEKDQSLNYLDVSIHRTPTDINTAIYRKPTFRDTIIPYTSNHTAHHIFATVKFLYNRMNSYDLKQTEYDQELNTIHNILHNNAFRISCHKPPTHSLKAPREPRTTKKKGPPLPMYTEKPPTSQTCSKTRN